MGRAALKGSRPPAGIFVHGKRVYIEIGSIEQTQRATAITQYEVDEVRGEKNECPRIEGAVGIKGRGGKVVGLHDKKNVVLSKQIASSNERHPWPVDLSLPPICLGLR